MDKLCLLLVAFLLAGQASALEINPELGNVTNTSIDLLTLNNSKGVPLFIERFYNSSASQAGWFGQGFGSQFETYLVKEADGSLTLHEYGQTPGRLFVSSAGKESIEAMVQQIIERKKIASNAVEIYRKSLMENRQMRIDAARELGLTGAPGAGDLFTSEDYDGEKIAMRGETYIRVARDGKTQVFSLDGKLIEWRDPLRKQIVTISYDEKDRATKITDNYSNQINIQWDLNNHIIALQSGKDNSSATFSYSGNFLSQVTNQNKETYSYEFNKGNLTKITYPDKRVLAIEYNPKTREPVKVSYPDGRREEYVTVVKTEDKLRTRTITLRKFLTSGKEDETLKWSFTHARDEQGINRLVSKTYDDGIVPETTTYRSCCYPQPTKIVMGASTVTFEYDGQNRLIKKIYSSGRTLLIFYDGKGLVSAIEVDGVTYLFGHDPKTTDLIEIQGPGYKAKLARDGGVLKAVTYSLKGDNKVHEAVYSYDKKKRLTGIAIDNKVRVRYEYSKKGQTFKYADQEESARLLETVDKMMTDAMILREVNYTF